MVQPCILAFICCMRLYSATVNVPNDGLIR
jgi:hypothetical protein